MKLFTLIITLFLGLTASAQTPFMATSLHQKKGTSDLSVASLQNPWVGGKLIRNISGDVTDFFQLSGSFIYAPVSGPGWSFPIVGNVALNNVDSFSLDNGVTLGAFPWKTLIEGDLTLIVHGGVSYTMPPTEDLNHQDRFTTLLGLEVALNGSDGGPPTTLSVAPSWIFESGPTPSNAFGLQFTGVVPIATGFGLLLEGTVPFKESVLIQKGIQAGVIMYSFIK